MNQKKVLSLRMAQKISDLLISLFVTFYIWDATGNNMRLICSYKIAFVISTLTAMLLFVHFSKHPKRKIIIIFGRLLQFFYAVVLTLLGADCIKYLIPLGILDGLGTGSYYLIYNIWEIEGVDETFYGRSKYQGIASAFSSIIKIFFPIISGALIAFYGLKYVLVCLILVDVSTLVFALSYKDNISKDNEKVSFVSYAKSINKDGIKDIGIFAIIDLFRGMTISYGSFELFIQVCLIGFFAGSLEYGAANSVVYCFTILFGLLFGKISKNYPNLPSKMRTITTAIFFIMGFTALVSGNAAVFIVFMTSYNIMNSIESMVYGTATGMCVSKYAKEYITECFVTNEVFLSIGRLIGFSVLMFLYKEPGSFGSGAKEIILFATYLIPFVAGLLFLNKLWKHGQK